MKRALVSALFLLSLSGSALAQQAAPYRHCILVVRHKLGSKDKLTLQVGAEPSAATEAGEAEQIEKLSHEADALNYLGGRGWELVSTTPVTTSAGDVGARHFLRRRQ